jgi:hypothetical protein
MNKRGQAAMEFLMTYGWAILAAIIAIGVLAYFGVFTPKGPTATLLDPPFQAVGGHSVVSATDGIDIEIKNGLDESVNITSVSVSTGGCTLTNSATIVPSGQSEVFNLDGCTGLIAGERFKGNVEVQYKKGDGQLTLRATGSIAETVTA